MGVWSRERAPPSPGAAGRAPRRWRRAARSMERPFREARPEDGAGPLPADSAAPPREDLSSKVSVGLRGGAAGPETVRAAAGAGSALPAALSP